MTTLPLARPARRFRPRRIIAAALAATAVGVAATGGASPAGATTSAEYLAHGKVVAHAIGVLLNVERALYGRPALHMNNKLIASAHAHNLRMARANSMSHQLPGEASLGSRISATHFQWNYAGENIGWNSDWSLAGVKYLEIIMFNEKPPDDGHRQNILSRNYNSIGVDVYYDLANHKVWITEDFGHGS